MRMRIISCMTAHDLLRSLVDRGQTQKQIEDATGIKQPTISRILAGSQKDLPFSAGKRLEAFAHAHLRTTTKKSS